MPVREAKLVSEVRYLDSAENSRIAAIADQLGKTPGINGRLKDVKCGETAWPYSLVKKALGGSRRIGYSQDSSTRLQQWRNGVILPEYQAMVVGNNRARIVVPDRGIGTFIFKPQPGDFIQIREGSQVSTMLGLAVVAERIDRTESALEEEIGDAQQIANRPFQKQFRDTGPMGSLPGNPWRGVHGRERDWEGERWRAEEEYAAKEKALGLEAERQQIVGQIEVFKPIRELLRPPQLKLIVPTL